MLMWIRIVPGLANIIICNALTAVHDIYIDIQQEMNTQWKQRHIDFLKWMLKGKFLVRCMPHINVSYFF